MTTTRSCAAGSKTSSPPASCRKATLTTDPSPKSSPETLQGTRGFTCLPGSGDGNLRCDGEASRQTDLFGLSPVRVRHSPPQAKNAGARSARARVLCGALKKLATRYARIASTNGLPTPATFGRKSGGLQPSAALNASLANRLMNQNWAHGFPACEHRWSSSDTLLETRAYRLVPSVPRNGASVVSLWPVPAAANAQSGTTALPDHCTGSNLPAAAACVRMMVWPCPMATNARGTRSAPQAGINLPEAAQTTKKTLSVWAAPLSRDYKDTKGMALQGTNPDGSLRTRGDTLARQAFAAWAAPTAPRAHDSDMTAFRYYPTKRQDDIVRQALGKHLSGSNANATNAPASLKSARLASDFSRWLMGIPEAWQALAPKSSGR